MKTSFRLKRTTKQYITVAILCILVIGGAAGITAFMIINQVKEEYQTLLNSAHQEMALNKRNVYVATVDISAGEAITKDNLKKATVYSSQPQESYITGKGIGKLSLIDIPADTQIMTTMVTDQAVSSELREMEYQVISISTNIASNDTVDVRIVYPNGESYIVLSKKIMKGVAEGMLGCYLWLDEEEILKMSAAIVDAALYSGSQLITTKYIEPAIQEASKVTYTPSIAILSLLERDPNILERCSQKLSKDIRKALENRLASSMDANVSEINWKVDPNVGAVDLPEPSPEPDPDNTDKPEVERKYNQDNIGNSEYNSEKNIENNTDRNSDRNIDRNMEGNILENKGNSTEGNANNIENSSESRTESNAETSTTNNKESNRDENPDNNTVVSPETNENELGAADNEKEYFHYVRGDETENNDIEYGE